MKIALNRRAHGIEMLSLDYDGGGTRFAGPKCCGRWDVVKEWPVTAKDLREIADEAEGVEEERERKAMR